jgi:2-dehydropantoate 2-reductase
MRLLVVGAGSTGGYFGGRLAAAGRDVTFLVRPGRAAQLRAQGLRIVSPHGDAALTPKLIEARDLDAPFDAVLLAVKAYALAAALTDMAPAVGPGTMILPVLNGMKHVDALIARFGAPALVGCVCKVAALVDGEGRIVQIAGFQELAYGEMNGSSTARVEQLDTFLRGAGFDARLSTTIEREMWEKWVLLATVGGLTCLMRGNIGKIAAAPGGRELAGALLDEAVAVVTAAGHPMTERFVAQARAMVTAPDSTQTSSMYRDMEAGNPIEAEQIVGDLIARGRQANVPTPLLAIAYTHLSVYQARLARGRAGG